jgi:STE24 endopeptidase
MTIWTWTVLIFATLATITSVYLATRQKAFVLAHRHAVPQRFADKISQAAHEKAADYTCTKLQLGNIEHIWGLVLLLLWTIGGGLGLLDELIRTLQWPDAWQGVIFLISFFLISHFINLPIELYRTFVVETRFGFNNMTAGLYISDMLKQLVLMLAIGTALAWVILTLMDSAGTLWWFYAWVVWSGFTLLMVWAYPTFIAPMFNQFEPLQAGEMRNRIEALLERCDFKNNGLFVMDGSRRSSHGNAYFTGLGNAKRIVFFDTLIKQLKPLEAEAVLAHELGHFRHGHVKKKLLSMALLSLVGFAILGWLTEQSWFYTGLGVTQRSNHAALALFMLVAPAFSFGLSPLMSYWSRKHEFEADAYAVNKQ